MIYLTVAHGPDRGRFFTLDAEQSYLIGRASENLILEDRKLSRYHARLDCHDGDWFISDLGSTNGTFVNGERVDRRCRLFDGDRVQLGLTLLVFGSSAYHRQTLPAAPVSQSPGEDASAGTGGVEIEQEDDQEHDQAAFDTGDAPPTLPVPRGRTTLTLRDAAAPSGDSLPVHVGEGPAELSLYGHGGRRPASQRGLWLVFAAVLLIGAALFGLYLYDSHRREVLMMQLAADSRFDPDQTRRDRMLANILGQVRSRENDEVTAELLNQVLEELSRQSALAHTTAKKQTALSQQLQRSLGEAPSGSAPGPDADATGQLKRLVERTAKELSEQESARREQLALQSQTVRLLRELLTELRGEEGSPPALAPGEAEAARAGDSDDRPAPESPKASVPRRMVFLVDTSEAMSPVMTAVRALLERTFERLDADRSFTVIAYRQQSVGDMASGELWPVHPSRRREAAAWLGGLDARGGAGGFDRALEQAAAHEPDAVWVFAPRLPADLDPKQMDFASLGFQRPPVIHTMQLLEQDPKASMAALAERTNGRHLVLRTSQLKQFDPTLGPTARR